MSIQWSNLHESLELHASNYYSKTDIHAEQSHAEADLNRVLFSVLAGAIISSNRQLQKRVLTFFDYSPWTEESVEQSQVGEVLMLLEALVQSREDRRMVPWPNLKAAVANTLEAEGSAVGSYPP